MKHFYLILGLFSALFITSCGKDDVIDIPDTKTTNVVVNENITTNTTWTSDKIYELGGRITVANGATLTIEPGTIIKGQAGTGPNATALLVARGSKLIAEGTPNKPIIFTSVADEINPDDIEVGVFSSPNLDPTVNGLWGGIIILGYAPISASTTESQIEGIPTSDQNGLYGGNNSNDNSGILRYVSIRHGGANIGSGNEINGLTLGGVGTATVIDNVEVVSNQDDGIEFFGGTVNATNIVVWNVGDDAIDTDQGWSGTLDNFTIVTPLGHCFELDGPEGTLITGHTIKNGNVFASNDAITSMDLINTDDNSIVDLRNIFITDISTGQQINRVEHNVGVVNFDNILLNVSDLQAHVNGTIPTGVFIGDIPQANVSSLDWTWAFVGGVLN